MPGKPNERPLDAHNARPGDGRGASGQALILALIALASAIPRLALGASQFIEYDGYWHIFIAQQDRWRNFWADIGANAHPPLFFLLMKAVLVVTRAHGPLIYRSISLVTGVASVYLVGRIAWKITNSDVRAYQTALAYGLALPAIIISCEVRSYMLGAFFVLLSFDCLVDLTRMEKPAAETRLRIGFAAWTILACLSHYYAFFYAGAAMLLLIARRRANWKTEAATCAPVVASILALYFLHARKLAVVLAHLLPFYLNGAEHESAAAFLVRNWKNLLNLFSPFTIGTNAAALGMLVLAIGSGIWLARSLTVRIAALMLGMIALAGLAGKYPFGGDLRQQYLLFPFLVLCAAILVERIAGMMSRFVPPYGRTTANFIVIAAIVWISAVQYNGYPKVSKDIGSDEMRIFNRLEPAPKAVFLDQYNLILFYISHHMWKWTSEKPPQPIAGTDVYRLRRGGEEMVVFRDKTDWNIDPTDPAVFARLAQCIRAENIPEISVFSPRQSPPREPYSDVRLTRRTLVKDAFDAGLCVNREKMNSVGWYATFRMSGCPPPDVNPLQVTGTFDNDSEDIDYYGKWHHGDFRQAASGTTTYTDTPGASAKLSFEGTEITWVYAQAFNRGIAEVRLDGQSRGEVDLYNPKIGWQMRRTFGGLAAGKHTFEVRVTGRKDAGSTAANVDIDELIAR